MQEVVGSIPISSTSNLLETSSLQLDGDGAGDGSGNGRGEWSRTFPPYPRSPHTSGAARIRLHGKLIPLGRHGSRESHRRYHQIKAAFDAGIEDPGLTIKIVADRYRDEFVAVKFAKSSERAIFAAALGRLCDAFGTFPASALTPVNYEDLLERMVREGLSEQTIRHYSSRIVRMYTWAARKNLVPGNVPYLLGLVPMPVIGEKNRRNAKRPVSDEDLDAALAAMPAPVSDMVRLQRLTGMRPGEVRLMRKREVDIGNTPWVYSPSLHKTAHRGKTRIVVLRTDAQQILERYLDHAKQSGEFVFVSERRAPYSKCRYHAIVQAACVRAGVPLFSPNRLRHSFATEADRALGRLGASIMLGHEKPDTTALYVERRLEDVVRLSEMLEASRRSQHSPSA